MKIKMWKEYLAGLLMSCAGTAAILLWIPRRPQPSPAS